MTKAPEQIHLWCELAAVNGLTPRTELIHCTTGTVFLKHLINLELLKLHSFSARSVHFGQEQERGLGREVSQTGDVWSSNILLWGMAAQLPRVTPPLFSGWHCCRLAGTGFFLSMCPVSNGQPRRLGDIPYHWCGVPSQGRCSQQYLGTQHRE